MNQTHYIVSVPAMEYFMESLKNLTSEVEHSQRTIIRLWNGDSKEVEATIDAIKKHGTFMNKKRPSNLEDDDLRVKFIGKILTVKYDFEHQESVLETLENQGQ